MLEESADFIFMLMLVFHKRVYFNILVGCSYVRLFCPCWCSIMDSVNLGVIFGFFGACVELLPAQTKAPAHYQVLEDVC